MLDTIARIQDLPRELSAAVAGGIQAALAWAFSPATATHIADAVRLEPLTRSTISTIFFLAGLFAVIYLLELLTAPTRSPYWSRTFRQDALYTLFYHGGFYHVLIWAGLANALETRLAFLRVEALTGLPGPVHWILYWTVLDFLYYWIHRWQHSWAPLWAIHSVHHSQEEMTFASTFRFHPLDQLLNNLLAVVPLIVIGVPTFSWLPLYVAMQLFDAAQHSALDWSYGKGYQVFVSPRFHAFHHSADPRHHNRNFGKILSLWDFMFGTAVREETRPVRLGVAGLPVPQTIVAQLIAPFTILFGRQDPAEAKPAAPNIEIRPAATASGAAYHASGSVE